MSVRFLQNKFENGIVRGTKALVNHLIFKGYFDLHTQATGLFLDAQKKEDIINFLKTLTNDVYLNNEEYKNSFE